YYQWRENIGVQKIVNQPANFTDNNSPLPLNVTADGNTIIFSHNANLLGNNPTNEWRTYRKSVGSNSITQIIDSDLSPFFAMNATGTRIFSDMLLWDSSTGVRAVANVASDRIISNWMDSSGYRIGFVSDGNYTGENQEGAFEYQNYEYFLYDDGIGF